MSVRSARTGEPVDPVRDHLDKAENWLALAEEEREKLQDAVLQEGGRDYIPRGGGYVLLFESAKDLAELHRAMAQTINDLTRQRVAVSASTFTSAVDDLAEQIRAQVKADEAAHQAATLRPGVDPEPSEDGALWTDDGTRFAYAVFPLGTPMDVYHPFRWLIVKSYAEVLRWQSGNVRHPSPDTWDGLDGKIGWADDTPLRRPTAEERAAFYGPEPDPQPAIMETHERTTTIPDNAPTPPEHACGDFVGTPGTLATAPGATCGRCGASNTAHGILAQPEGPIRFDATVAAFSDEALQEMRRAVKREWTRRAYTAPEARDRQERFDDMFREQR